MTYAYGAFKPVNSKTLDMFPVRVQVSECVNPPFEHTRPVWPYQVVTLYNLDTDEQLVDFEIQTIPGRNIDESNVFDVMEYMIYNFGKPPHHSNNGSPYDLTYSFSKDNGVRPITLRRAIGCRHFVIFIDGKALNITASGPGIENNLAKHEIPHLLLVQTRLDFEVGAWKAGINEIGFNLTFYEKGNGAQSPRVVYSNPQSFNYTPKQIARIQMMTAKRFIEDHTMLTNYTGNYNPNRFQKIVLSDQFWYLKSLDGKVIVTLIDRPVFKAMACIFDLLKQLSPEDRIHHGELHQQYLAKILAENSGKDQDKLIILESIHRIGSIRETLNSQSET